MDLFLYNLVTRVYFLLIWAAAFFNKKAKQWVAGRKGVFDKLELELQVKSSDKKIVWMHCASLGEFEQGRTLIEALKRERPDVEILLTFFSPSGYEFRKNYPHADWVFYLPEDTRHNARRFLEIVKPDLAVFVKYEFWFHYLRTLKKKRIPVILIAAAFRPEQPFFQWYGTLHRKMLACFTRIFVQTEDSAELLQSVTRTPVEVAGDNRIDRVLEIAQDPVESPCLEIFRGSSPILVCGSTWQEDEAVIFDAMQSKACWNWKIILAPHEINAARLEEIEKQSPFFAIRFTQLEVLDNEVLRKARVLILDNVGMLSRIYRYGRVAYVGGGFGAGIHNTLEPVAYGIPVVFGPKYEKFEEAKYLVSHGGGFSISNSTAFEKVMLELMKAETYQQAASEAGDFIRNNRGATVIVLRFIDDIL